MRSAIAVLAFVAGCGASTMIPAPGTVNGCAPSDFVADDADGGAVQVRYGEPFGLAYSPKCARVAPGGSVTFTGDVSRGSTFGAHPLRPGGALGTDPGASGNPILPQSAGSTYTVTFPATGTYGYFCQLHEGMGMYGAVQVK